MRTVILLGFNLIAIAIVQSQGIHQVDISPLSEKVYGIIFIGVILMDIFEFLSELGNKGSK